VKSSRYARENLTGFINAHTMRRRYSKAEWQRLKAAYLFGHSLGSISEATGVSQGTLSARCARHRWSRERVDGTEILRKKKNENEHE
jgi:transposase-like protein